MDEVSDRAFEALRALVDEQRDRCLWFLRRDFYPRTVAEALRVLDAIERYGDRAAFQAVARIRPWLSPSSRDESAGS
jgi:hypothetical protein